MRFPIRILSLLLAAAFFSCNKAEPPVEPAPRFELIIQNDYFEIQARYAVFLTNGDGIVKTFQWIPGEDSIHIEVPGSKPEDKFDCTILKLATLEAPGTGVKDTTLTLSTYTQLESGHFIHLRDPYFHQVSTLRFTLTGFNTLDSIVVSDALTLSRPQANNNYYGEYRLNNTGRCWMRVLVNGEHFWRFLSFSNLGQEVDAHEINVNNMLLLLAPPKEIDFPFVTTWQYKLDGAVDTAAYRFFPLSQHVRAPGGAVPVYNSDLVFEPVNNEDFDPNRPYIDLFRLQTTGPAVNGGYTYLSDNFYNSIPGALPEPAFNLDPTISANSRFFAVICSGSFDVLSIARSRTVTPKINWEVLLRPANGIVDYRLPDVPAELGALFPSLAQYAFNGPVRARADAYERLSYTQAIRQRLLNADPLWQARAGYLGREEAY